MLMNKGVVWSGWVWIWLLVLNRKVGRYLDIDKQQLAELLGEKNLPRPLAVQVWRSTPGALPSFCTACICTSYSWFINAILQYLFIFVCVFFWDVCYVQMCCKSHAGNSYILWVFCRDVVGSYRWLKWVESSELRACHLKMKCGKLGCPVLYCVGNYSLNLTLLH